MSPPQLATDTPVLDVPHPSEVGIFPLFGYELDVSIFHGRDGGCGHFFGVDIPLICQIGLDDDTGSVSTWHA